MNETTLTGGVTVTPKAADGSYYVIGKAPELLDATHAYLAEVFNAYIADRDGGSTVVVMSFTRPAAGWMTHSFRCDSSRTELLVVRLAEAVLAAHGARERDLRTAEGNAMNTNQLTYLHGLEAALAAVNRLCDNLSKDSEAAYDGPVMDYARAVTRYDGACKAWHTISDLINDAHKQAS